MKEKTEKKKCVFFDVCAAYIIQERKSNNQRFKILMTKKIVINLIKWSERFCFADFETCIYYQDRIRNK